MGTIHKYLDCYYRIGKRSLLFFSVVVRLAQWWFDECPGSTVPNPRQIRAHMKVTVPVDLASIVRS